MALSSNSSASGKDCITKNIKRTYVADTSSILTNLVNLVADEETADVKLVQDGLVIPAHKVLLMASSSFFRKMFLGEWMESGNQVVHLHDIPECKAVFPLFLGYLYSGHTALTVDNVAHMYMLADKYDVPSLLNLSGGFMTGIIDKGDLEYALKWLPFADLFSLSEIKESCISLIACNLEAAADFQLWRLLTLEQLVAILKADILIVKDEFALFWIVEKRLLAEDLLHVAENAKLVMKCINFKLMTNEQLLQVEKSKIVTKAGIDVVKEDLMQAFRHNALTSDNLQDDVNTTTAYGTKWYNEELHLETKFTDGTAPIHIATSSTGRGILQPQRWILRFRNDKATSAFPHKKSMEIVASKETSFVNSRVADRYRLQAKFAIYNADGLVYWTPTVTLEDVRIPDKVDDPLVVMDLPCGNISAMFSCKCTLVPGKVKYFVNLRKL